MKMAVIDTYDTSTSNAIPLRAQEPENGFANKMTMNASPKPTLLVAPSPESWAACAADKVIATASEAIAARGCCFMVLAGGSTPESLYRYLAAEHRDRIDWARLQFFLGDERLVPPEDPRSNLGMARRALLDHLPIRSAQVHAVDTQGTASQAADDYHRRLCDVVPGCSSHTPPRFDLLLLGLGTDGHIASLFPGKPALHVNSQWAAASGPGELPPPVDRVTLTYPAINAARIVLMLVTGASKSPTVARVVRGKESIDQCPARGVQPAQGEICWVLDPPAARELEVDNEAKG